MSDKLTVAQRASAALAKATKKNTLTGLRTSDIEDFLRPYSGQIQNALPAGASVTPNRIIAMAVYQISQTPALAGCSASSIIGALMQTSLLGLNPALKQCWYVPYQKQGATEAECQFQISYTGLIQLASRSGRVQQVYAHVVRQGDVFEVEEGLRRNLIHRPRTDSTAPLTHAYACIHYVGGGFDFCVMSAADIEKRRKVSPGQRNGQPVGVWEKWQDEMWKKTALRHLLKTAILSDDHHGQQVAAAVNADGGTIEIQNIKDGEPVAITYADQDAVIIEAPDLQDIRKGLEEIADLDNLQAYWQQGAKEWESRQDVRDLFTTKKQELQNGSN